MSDEITIRDMGDFMEALDPSNTPFLNMIDPLPKVGEQDRYGRTLLGYTEIDQEAKARLFVAWSEKYDRLKEMYATQGFELTDDEDHDGYYEPIQTEESLALKEEVDALWHQLVRMAPRPIWDRDVSPQGRMEWGLARPSDRQTPTD